MTKMKLTREELARIRALKAAMVGTVRARRTTLKALAREARGMEARARAVQALAVEVLEEMDREARR